MGEERGEGWQMTRKEGWIKVERRRRMGEEEEKEKGKEKREGETCEEIHMRG